MRYRSSYRAVILVFPWLTLVPSFALSQDLANVTIKSTDLGGGVHFLAGRGGNMAAFAGSDGVFLVDDQYAPLTEKILTAVATFSSQPVRFVLNTHWHGDHTGGNENLGRAGAVLVAHDNVRVRMSTEQFNEFFKDTTQASPAGALPVVTFNDEVTFHWNKDTVYIFHVEPAHTDGDAVVYFRKANVIHVGDLFFNGLYPFIDVDSGGSVLGVVAAVGRVLDMIDEGTQVIPGHGPMGDRAALGAYRDMLKDVSGRVEALLAQKKSLEEVKAAKPSATYDATWGGGFVKPDVFVEMLYRDLSRTR